VAKRCLAVFLLVLAVLSVSAEHAFAHIPCLCSNPPDQCTCFIQLGDTGFAVQQIIQVLHKKGYLQKIDKKSEFTPDVREAVIRLQEENGLVCTGWMDDETLNELLQDIPFNPSKRKVIKHRKELDYDIVCVPTDGGIRYHTDPLCSDMYNPRLITRRNAELLGIEHCQRRNCPEKSDISAEYSGIYLKPRDLPSDYYLPEEANEPPPDRSLPAESGESLYIGNKNSRTFHLETCSSARSMNEKNRIEFHTREEAIENGYKPCSKCKP